jgi:hypothetical protein
MGHAFVTPEVTLEVVVGGLQEMRYGCGHLNKSTTPPMPLPPQGVHKISYFTWNEAMLCSK